MNNPILDRNLMALQHTQLELARVLVRYGGDCEKHDAFEAFEMPDVSTVSRVYLAGFIDPKCVDQWCKSGRGLTLYCETLDEVMGLLGYCDLRQFIFSGVLRFELGVWRYALQRDGSTQLLSTLSYERLARWAKRAQGLQTKSFVIVANGTLFVDDTGDALVELGYSPLLIEVENLPVELWPDPKSLSVEFLVSINDRDGLEALAAALNAQCLVWQIDPDLNEARSEFPPGFFFGVVQAAR